MGVIDTVKHGFVKVFNLIQREIAYPSQVDSNDKYIPYFDVNDNFPVELNRLVAGSPTATSCLSTLTDFITGEGFNLGEDLENKVINNQGLTFGQFHGIQSDYLAHDWGVASLIKYNQTGDITEVFDLNFSNCRLGVPDDKGVISKIKYNPYYGTAHYKRTDTVEYDVYNPKHAVTQSARDKKWKGQIFWFGIKTKSHPFYPVPDYFTAKHWMNVERNAGVYFDENLENGYLTPTILKLIGDPNDPSGLMDGDQPIPKGKALSAELKKEFSGAGRVGKLMVFWGANKDEWPTVESFPSSGNADMFRVQDDHATKKITIATKVPAILANISEGVSLGGDGNTIRAAVKLMQQRVKRPQNILLAYYHNILSKMVDPVTENITIVPYNPFPELESIDPQVWEAMTPEERRKWIQDHTEIELEEEEVAPVAPSVAPAQAKAKVLNLHFDSYPEKARENVKRAIEWQEKMQVKCLKPSGREISNMILEGRALGPKEIGRLSRYLSRNLNNKDNPYDKSCLAVEYDAWGGVDMMVWANEKVKELKGKR